MHRFKLCIFKNDNFFEKPYIWPRPLGSLGIPKNPQVHGVSLESLDIAMNRIDFRGALVTWWTSAVDSSGRPKVGGSQVFFDKCDWSSIEIDIIKIYYTHTIPIILYPILIVFFDWYSIIFPHYSIFLIGGNQLY